MATARLRDVAMAHRDREPERADVLGGLLGEHHAAVHAARAAERDVELALALGQVVGQQELEEREPALEEDRGLRLVEHE
jgi:hypothetical protein